MAVQAALGSDIAMAFDECPPAGAPRADLERAVERTARWAERCVAAPRPDGQLRFGIVQGGIDARAARALGRPAHGAAVRRLRDRRAERGGGARGDVRRHRPRPPRCCPAARPRYFMGIGDPEGILRVIGAGIDMFDCVLPTRLGRTGSATTWEGRLNLRNARFARDDAPAAGGLRVPGLHALLARLHPPPRDAGRAARPAAADAAQPLVPARVVP